MCIKIENCKINGKIYHLINEFMKEKTLRVAKENTLLEEKQIENRMFNGRS
jgi:hypothetical protein